MKDVQGSGDQRGIAIGRVGITAIKYPITILDRTNKSQHTIADVTLSANLPHHHKGTHMSRFVEVLNRHHEHITMANFPVMLHDVASRLDARSAQIHLKFPYFIEKTAPVSQASSLMSYECSFFAVANGKVQDFILSVRVPITTLCPCSKTISDYGAHNQRGLAEMQVRSVRNKNGSLRLIWIEELIEIAEQCCSAPVYALLKRPDERSVTMTAYDNPMFVEDVVRELAVRLKADQRVAWFRAHVESEESIHNHNAFASLEWHRPKTTAAKRSSKRTALNKAGLKKTAPKTAAAK